MNIDTEKAHAIIEKMERIFQEIESMIKKYIIEVSNKTEDEKLKHNIENALETLSKVEGQLKTLPSQHLNDTIKKVRQDFAGLRLDIERLNKDKKYDYLVSDIKNKETEIESLLDVELGEIDEFKNAT